MFLFTTASAGGRKASRRRRKQADRARSTLGPRWRERPPPLFRPARIACSPLSPRYLDSSPRVGNDVTNVETNDGDETKEAGRITLEVSRRSWLTGVAVVSAGLALDATPVAAADFFAGKILNFYVGIPPGGAYDLVPLTSAAHIGKYIPGNPRVVVENMPGAGSLTMMNFLYNQATRDGTSIGFPMNTMLLEPTLKLVSGTTGNAHFELAHMAWIGTPARGSRGRLGRRQFANQIFCRFALPGSHLRFNRRRRGQYGDRKTHEQAA